MKRNAFRKKIEAKGAIVNGTTEEFGEGKGGLWLSAEQGDCFNQDAWQFDPHEQKYTLGIKNVIYKIAQDSGWYFEFYDYGTVWLTKAKTKGGEIPLIILNKILIT